MYPVTIDFLDKMRADKRQVFGRVQVDYTNPFIDQSIQITASENANVSYPAQTADSVSEPFAKIASLDGSWVLGEYALAPSTLEEAEIHQMGWWGSQFAGEDGSFEEPYPMLTVTFQSRPIHSLKVIGDTKRWEYPVDFKINLYGDMGELKYTHEVTGNNHPIWEEYITSITEVVKMTLEIQKWSCAGRQAKILEFFTSIQEIYEGDDILMINLLEEREVSQGSLPIGNISANEIVVRLHNRNRKFDADNAQSPLYQLLTTNRRIRAWLGMEIEGEIEYVPLGVFWSGDWSTPEDDIYVETSGRDKLELLRKTTFSTSQVLQNISLYDIAVMIFRDAELEENEYWIDESLKGYVVPYMWFGEVSHRNALHEVAKACLGYVYCDKEGVIRIEGWAYLLLHKETSVLTITPDDYFTKNRPQRWNEIANCIKVTTYPLKPADSLEEVYRSNETEIIAAGQTRTITAYFNKSPCIEAGALLEGNTENTYISEATYYAWGANIKITNSGTENDSFVLVVNAKPLCVTGQEGIVVEDEASITSNGRIVYELPECHLIQSRELAESIANNLLEIFKNPRKDIELEWRGNPALELGDKFTVTDLNGYSADFYLISQEFEYDGSLRSRIKGRVSTTTEEYFVNAISPLEF